MPLQVAAYIGRNGLVLKAPTIAGSAGQALVLDANGDLRFDTVTTSPGGSSGQIQYNNNGVFGSTTNMRWSAISPELIYDGQFKVSNINANTNTRILIGGTHYSENLIDFNSNQVNCRQGIIFYQANSNTSTELYQVPPSGWNPNVANSFTINMSSGGHPGLYIRNGATAIAHFAQNGATTLTAGSATVIPLTLKLAATPTANAFEINSSSGSGGDRGNITGYGCVNVRGDAIGERVLLDVRRRSGAADNNRLLAVRADPTYDNLGGITLLDQIAFTTSGNGVFVDRYDSSSYRRWRWYPGVAMVFNNSTVLQWSDQAWDVGIGAIDSGVARNSAGVLEINNGTAGQYRDLILRKLTATITRVRNWTLLTRYRNWSVNTRERNYEL